MAFDDVDWAAEEEVFGGGFGFEGGGVVGVLGVAAGFGWVEACGVVVRIAEVGGVCRGFEELAARRPAAMRRPRIRSASGRVRWFRRGGLLGGRASSLARVFRRIPRAAVSAPRRRPFVGPASHRETVAASTPMCRAKSTPDQPRAFLRKRISAPVSRLGRRMRASARAWFSCTMSGISTSKSPHVAQRCTGTLTRVARIPSRSYRYVSLLVCVAEPHCMHFMFRAAHPCLDILS